RHGALDGELTPGERSRLWRAPPGAGALAGGGVVVRSPGRGGGPPWCHAMASALAALLAERRVPVTWLAVVRQGQQLDAVPAAVDRRLFEVPASPSLARVAVDSRHLPTEQELTRMLRQPGPSAVG